MRLSRGSVPVPLAERITAFHPPALIAVCLAVVALMPRIMQLSDFMTTDEAYHWITRTERFSAALARQDWPATLQTGHPGVTLLWLGSLGLALERFFVASGWAHVASQVDHLAWLRLPAALVEAFLIPAAYLLLRRLVMPATAFISALLWAASPYLIAHARLLHLDALLTVFVTFSVLLALLATSAARTLRGRLARPPLALVTPAWIASGVCAGLALLTKGPALILLPVIGLLLLWRTPARRMRDRLRRASMLYLLWLAVALVVVVALWPALWASPARALRSYVEEIMANGGRPNGDGQFFLGRAVDDPGPLFYPVANLFRMTPAMLLGLLVYAGYALRDYRTRRGAPTQSPKAKTHHQVLLALLAFALCWTLVMTLGPKKFDRYVLPTWPALLVLAGAGLARWADWKGHADSSARLPSTIKTALVGLALALEFVQPALYHPYYLSYYNPLLGGGAVAQRALLIGWGEGMDQAGAALGARPDIGYGAVLSALPPTLQPFVSVPVKPITEYGQSPANYAVVYLESVQRAAFPDIYARIQQTVPIQHITIHGIEYAAIYQLPKPYARPVGAQFGQALHLRGVTIVRSAQHITVTPSWDVRGMIGADYTLFLHLINAQGRRVTQVDVAPGGADAPPTSAWQPGQQIAVPIDIVLPAPLPSGEYQLVMGLYDPATGARVPVEGGTRADPASAGPHTLLIETITGAAAQLNNRAGGA